MRCSLRSASIQVATFGISFDALPHVPTSRAVSRSKARRSTAAHSVRAGVPNLLYGLSVKFFCHLQYRSRRSPIAHSATPSANPSSLGLAHCDVNPFIVIAEGAPRQAARAERRSMRRVVRSTRRPTSWLRTPLSEPATRMLPVGMTAREYRPLSAEQKACETSGRCSAAASVASTSRRTPMHGLPRRILTCSGCSFPRCSAMASSPARGCMAHSRFAFRENRKSFLARTL
jgi:hypothetical protein